MKNQMYFLFKSMEVNLNMSQLKRPMQENNLGFSKKNVRRNSNRMSFSFII